jgi:predicted AAA+ superfamily ATPase
MYLNRIIEKDITWAVENFPVTAVTGARQCGKSTLVKFLAKNNFPNTLYLDLERPSDLLKLENAEWFLTSQKNKLICIDEIQRRPDLFPVIRSLVDEWDKSGCFLILGSASRDLLLQSSESLAGRIIYKQLTPFLWTELCNLSVEDYFVRGGFPRSVLAKDDKISVEWRKNFVSTFLERDLSQWVHFTPATMRRLWQMLAHLNGQTVNYSKLGNSLGVSNQTVKNYADLLKSTYMIDVIEPYLSNLGKRLVKSPKIYISDSGIAAALLEINSFVELSGHPSFGALWESIILANLRGSFPNAKLFFYRTSGGAEIDFVMIHNNCVIAIECKASYVPSLSAGNYLAIEDISPVHTFVVTPSSDCWSMKQGIDVVSIEKLPEAINVRLSDVEQQ